MESRKSVIKELCKKFENTPGDNNHAHGSSLDELSGNNIYLATELVENSRSKTSVVPTSKTPTKKLDANTCSNLKWSNYKEMYNGVVLRKQEEKHCGVQKKPKPYAEIQPMVHHSKENSSKSPSKPSNNEKFFQESLQKKQFISDRKKLFEKNKQIATEEQKINRSRSKSVPFASALGSTSYDNVEGDIHHASFAVARTDSNVSRKNNTNRHPMMPAPKIDNYPTPPKKPPRTFAHDRYIETKQCVFSKNQIGNSKDYDTTDKPNFFTPKSNGSPPVFVDLTSINLEPSKHYGTLKRSFSEEHVYAEPYEALYYGCVAQNPKSVTLYAQPNVPKCQSRSISLKRENNQLHYMSTPIVDIESCVGIKSPQQKNKMGNGISITPSRKVKSTTANVKEIVNQSFNQLWKKLYIKGENEELDPNADDVTGDSGSEVSMKDVQERIIYVRSLKSKIIGTVGSELKKERSNLFDCLLVSCLTPARKDSLPKPRLIYKFPNQKESEYEQMMIPQLCFPDCATIKSTTSYKSETFMFVVKDGNGSQTYGFCLRLLGSPQVPKTAFLTLPTVVCLLTNRNSVALYMKILLEIEKHLFLSQPDFQEYVSRLYNTDVPIPGRFFWLPDMSELNKNQRTQILRPTDNRIINTEITHLLQFLEVDLLLQIVASLLLERRVLLVADSSSTLFKCSMAILSLLYPLSWQHSVLPVLPESLLAQCCSNSPYLFGVSSQCVHKVMDIQQEKILIVDLNCGFKLREVGDEQTILPTRSQKAVKCALSLAKNMTDPTEMLRDVMISEAFIRMFVETIGHCDKYITEQNRGNLVFQREGFFKYPSSKSLQFFLTWFCETQMFEVFIEERIKLKQTSSIRKQPVFSAPQGLFDRRLEEFWKQCHGTTGIKGNVRELGKKVKNLGERLKGFKGF